MKLIIEEGDFSPNVTTDDLNDPGYGYRFEISRRPNREPFAVLKYRGAGRVVPSEKLKVVIGKPPKPKAAKPAAAKSQPKRKPRAKAEA